MIRKIWKIVENLLFGMAVVGLILMVSWGLTKMSREAEHERVTAIVNGILADREAAE